MTTSNHVFSAFSFMSFVLTLVPFPWHLQAWNTGTCIFMVWISLGSLFLFINSVVWDDNTVNWAPVYCDIFSKFFIGLAVSLPATGLCINRRLYLILRVSSVTQTAAEKRKNMFTDLSIGVGIPVVVMILHTVVQGHRFDIFEGIGCWPATYYTPLTYVLIYVPGFCLSIAATVYAILNIISLKKSYDLKKLLSSNGSNSLTPHRYIRLMCLAGIEALADVPLNVYVIVASVRRGVAPWISWADTHYDFGRVEQYSSEILRSAPDVVANLESARWSVVFCGFFFFAFFGFAEEAQKNYRLAYNSIASKFGWRLVSVPGIASGPNSRGINARNQLSGANGTESWMGSFNAFADRIKFIILHSPRSASSSRKSTTDNCMTELGTIKGLPVYVTREMIQKRDEDSQSAFTTLTQVSTWTSGNAASVDLVHQESKHEIHKKPSALSCTKSLEGGEQDLEWGSNVTDSIPPSLTAPPHKEPPQQQVIVATRNSAHFSPISPALRTPPRQMLPTSVSPSPQELSHLEPDLEMTLSHRDTHSAEERV